MLGRGLGSEVKEVTNPPIIWLSSAKIPPRGEGLDDNGFENKLNINKIFIKQVKY